TPRMSVLRPVAASLVLVLAACSPPGPFTLLDADSARDGRKPAVRVAGDAPQALTAASADRVGDTSRSVLPRRDSLYAPLSSAEQAWIDRTVASLDVRGKVAQMVSVWVLGDFTNAAAPAYAAIE